MSIVRSVSRGGGSLHLINKTIVVLGIISLLGGCATVSEQQYKLAQQSIQQGDYGSAFDQAAQSLQANIANYQLIGLFPSIVQNAYEQQLAGVERHKQTRDWDQAAYGYDRIAAMNQTITRIQQSLTLFAGKITTSNANRAAIGNLLDIKPGDVAAQRDESYEKAAAAHYANGQRYAKGSAFRQAQSEFSSSLSFINPYHDAREQAEKNRHLADLADAKMHYMQALQAVQKRDHRAAATAFARADSFVPGYRDAYTMAAKYKGIADLEDALLRYQRGELLAAEQHYRAAASAFTEALSFVPAYRDATILATRYTELANREDAHRYYTEGLQQMNQQQFAEAARSFDQAEQFVSGFRNARHMAEKARSFVPPDDYQLRHLVQQSVQQGIPLTWLHDVHRGETEDVHIASLSVFRQGRFNQQQEFWPYRLRLTGTCKLEIAKDNEPVVSFDTVVDYRVFRDDFGNWKATFRQENRGH